MLKNEKELFFYLNTIKQGPKISMVDGMSFQRNNIQLMLSAALRPTETEFLQRLPIQHSRAYRNSVRRRFHNPRKVVLCAVHVS